MKTNISTVNARIFYLLIGILFIGPGLKAETLTDSNGKDSLPFFEMSLEQLMNVNVTVASELPMTSRESPGILTILTDEEIKKTGAKDLMDVLRLIPGFDFGVDVEGIVGIAVRGNWGHEGKVLLLWDGIDLNEDLYSTLQFGGHYPVSQIKRLEIIRGPGSAMYGGNAEYAVINVVTTNNRELNGANADVTYSQMSKTFSQRCVSVNVGKDFGSLHVNYSTYLNESNRSQLPYTDRDGASYDMTNQSGIHTMQQRTDVYWKNFSATGFVDNYTVNQRDGYSNIYLRDYPTKFNSYYFISKYDIKLNRFTLTPGIRYKHNQPWSFDKSYPDDNFAPYKSSVSRSEYYLNSSYDLSDKLHIISGIKYYNQYAQQLLDTNTFSDGSKTYSLKNYSAFVQSVVTVKKLNFILGARYNNNNRFNASFVPRLGITTVHDSWHVKLLYSQAFRAPSIENINAEPNILPERTAVLEVEIGVKLSENSYLTTNVFDVTTKDPIIYYYDQNNKDMYKNESPTGTSGFEMEYKWKHNKWMLNANYSFYTTSGHDVITTYSVPGYTNRVLAIPQSKIAVFGQMPIYRNISCSPTLVWVSDRYASMTSSENNVLVTRYKPNLNAGINIVFTDAFTKGLTLQAGVFNLLDTKNYYIQPYNSDHSPLPGLSREFQLRITYNVSFSK